MNNEEEVITKHLSALYFEVRREHDERRFHRDMLFGPEGSVEIFRTQLGL